MVVHIEEARGPNGHEFDVVSAVNLAKDDDVQAFVKELQDQALVPVKRG